MLSQWTCVRSLSGDAGSRIQLDIEPSLNLTAVPRGRLHIRVQQRTNAHSFTFKLLGSAGGQMLWEGPSSGRDSEPLKVERDPTRPALPVYYCNQQQPVFTCLTGKS